MAAVHDVVTRFIRPLPLARCAWHRQVPVSAFEPVAASLWVILHISRNLPIVCVQCHLGPYLGPYGASKTATRSWPSSHQLAAQWKGQLGVGRRSYWLAVAFQTVVASGSLLGAPDAWIGWWMTLGGRLTGAFMFGCVLWTVGFGAERCDFGDYVGYPFWETDPFEQPNCGVKGTAPEIVISGSGDGALQDFLRITTNLPSAEQVMRRANLSPQQRTRLERELYYAEDLGPRAFPWGPGPEVLGKR